MDGGVVNCWQKLEQRVRRNRIDLKCAGDEKMNGMARLNPGRIRADLGRDDSLAVNDRRLGERVLEEQPVITSLASRREQSGAMRW